MRKSLAVLTTFVCLVGSALPDTAQAKAKMQVYPTRVVLREGQTTAEVNVINAGDAIGSYRADLIDMQMQEEGALQKVDDMPYSAKGFLRLSPRSVTVLPGQSQKFRLLARVPSKLEAGEYRTHMQIFMSADDVGAQQSEHGVGLAANLKPRILLSIPVEIVRGDVHASAKLEEAVLENTAGAMNARLVFSAEGNASAVGDVKIIWQKGDQQHSVAELKGLRIYREVPRRVVDIAVKAPEGMTMQGGVLRVEYHHTEDDGGALISEKTINL